MINKLSVRELATWLHNNYEDLSKELNWETQKKCQVEYEDLPEENRAVMEFLSAKILTEIDLIEKNVIDKCKRKLDEVLKE